MTSFKPARRRHSRLAQLEALLATLTVQEQAASPQTEEEWLLQFRCNEQDGLYQQEPDFPWLFNRYEQALQQAQASTDPSFYPSVDFEPHLDEPGRLRLWRNQWRFPELHRTSLALLTMTLRAIEEKPPITRTEWEHLKDWYLIERHRLPSQSGAIPLPTGRSLSRSAIDHEIRSYDGVIIHGSETALRDMRLLHQQFGNNMN